MRPASARHSLLAEHPVFDTAWQSERGPLLAVMTCEDLDAGRATQHRLGAMTDRLSDANPPKHEFQIIEHRVAPFGGANDPTGTP